MSEHLSDGKFASKEITGAPVRDTSKIGKGKPGPGRPKGLQNKVTRDVKEFLAALVSSTDVQQAVEARIVKGDAVAFFRALEHVVGKPKETSDIKLSGKLEFGWSKDEDA